MVKKDGSWGRALIFGLPAAALMLALFFYWFALADRYLIFLYDHDMGARVPDTSPFSRVTSSRYWMAGLVAAGAVMLFYLGVNWLLGRLSKRAHAPSWRRVWLVAAALLLLGIPLITMGFNAPVLPLALALWVTLVALAGLALALLPGELAARSPVRLLWLAADGWGLALILLTLPHLEDFKLWLGMGNGWRLTMSLVLMLSGLLWLLLLSFLRAWLRIPVDKSGALFLAGFGVAYLVLPLVHYTLATDGYFYLTNSDNFLARGLEMQILAWVGAGLVARGIVRVRLVLRGWRKPEEE